MAPTKPLYLLEAQGLIKLKEGVGFTATVLDIASNPKNLVIKELEAAQIPRSLADVDLGIINVCSVCGCTLEGEAPKRCPVCGAKKEEFVQF